VVLYQVACQLGLVPAREAHPHVVIRIFAPFFHEKVVRRSDSPPIDGLPTDAEIPIEAIDRVVVRAGLLLHTRGVRPLAEKLHDTRSALAA
jgi:hypothetical protein